MVQEYISTRLDAIRTEILHPYSLAWPSAKSVTKARKVLCLESPTDTSQELYSSDVVHSCLFQFILASSWLPDTLYRSIRMTSVSWDRACPEQITS